MHHGLHEVDQRTHSLDTHTHTRKRIRLTTDDSTSLHSKPSHSIFDDKFLHYISSRDLVLLLVLDAISGVLWHSRYMRHLTFISFSFILVKRCEWADEWGSHIHAPDQPSKDDLVSLDFFSLLTLFVCRCTAAVLSVPFFSVFPNRFKRFMKWRKSF